MRAAIVVHKAPLTSFDAIATGNGNPSMSHTGVEIILEPVPDIELKSVAPKAVPNIIAVLPQSMSRILFLPQWKGFDYFVRLKIAHHKRDFVYSLNQWQFF